MSEDGFSDYLLEEPNMEIQVVTLLNAVFDLRVSSTDTIREIKQRIQRIEGIPIHQQNLIYQSTVLKDYRRLCDVGIRNGSVIKLVLAMKGGPISTRRLSLSCEHHIMIKELQELLETTRDEMGERLSPGSKVSVLVFKEGEILNLLRVIENEDGSYSPYTERAIAPPLKGATKGRTHTAMFDKLVEDTDMMTKISNLRKRMVDVHARRKQRDNVTTVRTFEDCYFGECSGGPEDDDDDGENDDDDVEQIAQGIVALREQNDEEDVDDEESVVEQLSENAKLAYKLFRECDKLMERIDLKILEKTKQDEEENGSECGEEVALKDKHRIKPPQSEQRKSIYAENGGALSITRQNYARMHRKAIIECSKSRNLLELTTAAAAESNSREENLLKVVPTIPKRQSVHLARLVERKLEETTGRQDVWQIRNASASSTSKTERLQHGAGSASKFGLVKRRQSLDFTTAATARSFDEQKAVDYGGGEICSGNLFQQFVTTTTAASPSAIPPQYAPKDEEELCDYYFRNQVRSPLYGRKSRNELATCNNGGNVLSSSECETSSIQRLTNESSLAAPTSIICNNNLSDDEDNNNNESLNNCKAPENFNELYGYYNLGCSTELLETTTTKTKVKQSSPSSSTIENKNNKQLVDKNDKLDVLPPVVLKKKSSRCNECNKRLNITNIYNCRCGKMFCSTHRYPEEHECSYDFKSEGRKILEHQNPLVTADKINRI